MKITNIETFLVDSGWWPFLFVKIETDEGITGYGECTETRQPHGVVGSIEDFSKLLIGKDPRSFEMLLLDLKRISIQSRGGIAYKAISGIELAL
ncbi:MAG: mandelate racemase/muconate lactonizing enzyme family protein, partial [SAR202 cluster bacterium]|nr:mandelate racemase/muconate lactonizing enzyme family protein [SAR202 cluster bacterium]